MEKRKNERHAILDNKGLHVTIALKLHCFSKK